MPVPPGYDLVGRYRIERVLGKGGFGVTYLARDLVLDRQVALKEFFPAHQDLNRSAAGEIVLAGQPQVWSQAMYQRWLERFLREGRILAKVNHPSVVRVWDIFAAQSTAYLVLQYLPGQSLFHYLQQGAMEEELIESFMDGIVEALSLVHDLGFYHLDISPSNIMIHDGRGVLIDFGAAKPAVGEVKSTTVQKEGYLPPELLAPQRTHIGAHTDIFQLGVVLHELLRRELPPPWSKWSEAWTPSTDTRWHTVLKTALNPTINQRASSLRRWWSKLGPATAIANPSEDRAIVALGNRTVASLRQDEAALSLLKQVTGYGLPYLKGQLKQGSGNERVKNRFAKRWPN